MSIVQLCLWDSKLCRKCGCVKPFEDFPRNCLNKDGLGIYCKECNRAQARAWSEKNAERKRQQRREYYKTNTEHVLRINQRSYAKHRDKRRAHGREYRQINSWQKRFPERAALNQRVRQHRKRGNGGAFTAAEWEALCAQYDYKCLCCGEYKPLTVDHVVPVSKGGDSSIANIQPLCQSCNSSKGDRYIDYRPSESPRN